MARNAGAAEGKHRDTEDTEMQKERASPTCLAVLLEMAATRFIWVGPMALMLGCLAGCSNEPKVYVVKGAVTFDGQPVQEGDIMFSSPAGDRGPDAGKIKDGAYELKTTEGKKRVEISAAKIQPGGARGAGGEPVPEEYIPERYNSQSELTADVRPTPANVIDFKLQSRK